MGVVFTLGRCIEFSLQNGDSALHMASRDGLVDVVRALCERGVTEIDALNVEGLSPLHVAARSGHIDVVRLLCLYGCDVKQRSSEGITAEVAAYAQGYGCIGELLGKLQNKAQLDLFISDLREDIINPSPILKLKLLGSSGVGKSTLVETLKTGYIASWFRRSKSAGSAFGLGLGGALKRGLWHDEQRSGTWVSIDTSSTSSHSPKKQKWWQQNFLLQHHHHHHGAFEGKNSESLEDSGGGFLPERNSSVSLSFDYFHDHYTRGVAIENVKISGGGGEWSVWDFSGQECYFVSYDLFLGSSQCAHLVLFDCSHGASVAYQQANFWLSFLRARLPVRRPWTRGGRCMRAAPVILVGTHVDLIPANGQHQHGASFHTHSGYHRSLSHNSAEEYAGAFEAMRGQLEFNHGHALDIHPRVFLIDCHAATSQAIKDLKSVLAALSTTLAGEVAKSNGFLSATLETLKDVDAEIDLDTSSSFGSTMRRLSIGSSSGRHRSLTPKRSQSLSLSGFPVLGWPAFLEFLRSRVNPLALESHVETLARQLQLMGRLVILDSPRSRAGGGCWWAPTPYDGAGEEDGDGGFMDEDSSMVVLSPQWLGTEIIGRLLSLEFRGIARPSGVYSVDDFTAVFPCTATQNELIPLLEALQLCNQVVVLPERSPKIRRTKSTALVGDNKSQDFTDNDDQDEEKEEEEEEGDDYDRFFSQSNPKSALTPLTPVASSSSRSNICDFLEGSIEDNLLENTAGEDEEECLDDPEVEVELPSFNLLDREDCLCVDDLWRDEAMTSPHFVASGLRLRPPAPSLSPFFLHIFPKIQVALRWYFEEERERERLEGSASSVSMRMRTIASNGDIRHCWLESAREDSLLEANLEGAAVNQFEELSGAQESVTLVEGFPFKLRQWSLGSRLDSRFSSCFICLRQDSCGDYLDIYTRGPRDSLWEVFLNQHRVYALVLKVVFVICPGVCMETHLLSMDQDTVNALPPVFAPESHTPVRIGHYLLNPTSASHFVNVKELLCFGSQQAADRVEWMPDLPVSALPDALMLQIAGLLDPPNPEGRDWALLALQMNLGDKQQGSEPLDRSADAGDIWKRFQEAANPSASAAGAEQYQSARHVSLDKCGRTESITSQCESGCVCCAAPSHHTSKRKNRGKGYHETSFSRRKSKQEEDTGLEADASHTATLLQLWQAAAPHSSTIGNLVRKLRTIERHDVADLILRLAPLYKLKNVVTVQAS